jgi:polysaccharide biosynthesis transport protein
MTVADVVRTIRARWLLFTVCCIVPLAAAVAVARSTAPVYSATAGLFVGPTRAATGQDAYQNAFSAAQLAQQETPSYASLVDSPAVLRGVIADLHLATTPYQLSQQVSATAPANSVVIDITARAGSAAEARDIANHTALRFARLAGKLTVAVLAKSSVGPSAVGRTFVGPAVRLTLVTPAQLPTAPSSSHKTTKLALGLIVGLAVGLTAVIVREKTDRRVRTVGEARSSTGCGFVTSVGGTGGRAASLIRFVTSIGGTGGRAGSLIRRAGLPIRTADRGLSTAESFRRLRLGLAPALNAHHARSLAVTSLAPGKSGPAVAINLALVMAEAGSSVLLVDADAHAGQIAGHFGIDSPLGLTTVISEQTPAESAFQQYHENLRILPAGPPAAGTEQPSPAELAQLLDKWQGTSDYIVVQVGPILAHALAAELSAAAHTVLLVAKRDEARQEDLRLATEMLRNANADILGVVLAPAHLAVRPSEYRTGRPGSTPALAAASNGQGIAAPRQAGERAPAPRAAQRTRTPRREQ